MKVSASPRATLIGDVVGSRQTADRAALHRRLAEGLAEVASTATDPPAFTVGDEFQGSYPSVGAAIDAALGIRLDVGPDIDVRFGIGWGEVTILDPSTGIQDGPGTTDGSFINIAGSAAANSYSSVAAIADYPGKADFAARYKAAYGVDPGAYAASGYACAQVIIAAIAAAAAKGDVTREAVRAAAVDPTVTYQTVLGPVQFDANGDTSQHIISLYKVDMTQAGGKGDWVFEKQIDFK